MTKQRLEILSAIIIILGLVFVVWYVLQNPTGKNGKQIDGGNIATDNPAVVSEVIPTAPPEILPNPVARTFVERFGSFSTESDYKNIEDVLSLVTTDLQVQLKQLLKDSRAQKNNSFYGVSTKVIGFNVVESTDTEMKAEIITQRSESIESPANTSVRYQNIALQLVKLDGEWLVSDYTWE
ncbi:hypothetical protein CO173_04180 [Candidatus Uhrbacteria bacterium CG_4_9_14_3_um_filter_41_35]|uniref:Uncharacterized protein n=1 Tax=Candidatus Uhrbacteria bacterium CG_4_9_14_3_um_filter_41_35 TaxID=1975034 RepID=A0A2M7XDJ3_9BACT|nr:MAG: hypothetical protein COV92_02455 [Candidatus Uhrbacteria bacterium CG11_big_fil_rev_8_21_14_0_20_41_9]PJA45933.1 MAG: hypothetical protein CO173_04180 [Candidatus Uhrbacteria bacterium CG_4_9_14_3_um_filter_41_35]